jgi:hypothetical protein
LDKNEEDLILGRWIACKMDITYNKLSHSDDLNEIARLSEDIGILAGIRIKLGIKNELNESNNPRLERQGI